MAIKKTHRGKPIDMDSIRMKNEKVIAAGNASLNARGDVVKRDKVVVKSEEIAKAYYENSSNNVRHGSVIRPVSLPIGDAVLQPQEVNVKSENSSTVVDNVAQKSKTKTTTKKNTI